LDSQVALVTGSSSGIGRATALALARKGFVTFATMRDLSKRQVIESEAKTDSKSLRVVQLDVTKDTSVKSAIDSVLSEAGRIDLLVNNAGFGTTGAFEDLLIDELRQQFETNVFGVVRVTQAVLPTMRKQRSGRRSEEHTSELQSPDHLVCRLLLEKKKKKRIIYVVGKEMV